MGIVGWGRAFNLRFMPNGPLRTNCYHRPMPRMGIFGGGHMSITENINIQQGPSGFWGFMTGLTQGLFGGGIFGMGMGGGLFGMGGFSPFGFLNSNPTIQGAQQPQVSEDKSLKNLIQVYGSDYEIVSHPKKEGFYQAHSKKGGELIEGDYDTVMKKLAEIKEEAKVAPQIEKSDAELKAEEEAKKKAEEEAKKKAEEEAKAKVGSDEGPEASIKVSKSRSKKVDNDKKAEKTNVPDENAYKNKAYPVRIGVQSSWSFGTCTYTATGTFTDEKGNKHDINLQQQKVLVTPSFRSGPSDLAISQDIIPKLKAKAEELGFPNLKFILPKDIANAGK